MSGVGKPFSFVFERIKEGSPACEEVRKMKSFSLGLPFFASFLWVSKEMKNKLRQKRNNTLWVIKKIQTTRSTIGDIKNCSSEGKLIQITYLSFFSPPSSAFGAGAASPSAAFSPSAASPASADASDAAASSSFSSS